MKNCSAEEIMKQLQEPFPPEDIEWRPQRSIKKDSKAWAIVVPYITNRAIQNRLDKIFGVSGWKNEFREFAGGIICGISCRIEGEWITKWDGSELTAIEPLKGGLSGAMKRVAVQFGIGRYLYNLGEIMVDVFNNRRDGSIYVNDKKQQVKGYFMPPQLPKNALPEGYSYPNQSQGNGHNTGKQEQTSNSNSQNGNQSNNQRSSNQPNRQKLVSDLEQYLKNTGLTREPNLIMPLFLKIQPNLKQRNVEEVFKKASIEELKEIYSVIRPVNDLLIIGHQYQVPTNELLRYVQILCPQTNIESIIHCFTRVNKDMLRQIIDFIEGDKANGSLNIA